MQFKISPYGNVSIAGIDRIVENYFQIVGEPGKAKRHGRITKEKVPGAAGMVWRLHNSPKGTRWLGYVPNGAEIINPDPHTAVDGESLTGMHERILDAMMSDDTEVEFHGTACNIRKIVNWRDHFPVDTEKVKRREMFQAIAKQMNEAKGRILTTSLKILAGIPKEHGIGKPDGLNARLLGIARGCPQLDNAMILKAMQHASKHMADDILQKMKGRMAENLKSG